MKIISIIGIRPDILRMSELFKKLDQNFEHIQIHTGQHFSFELSDVFFKELNIREPDYNWTIGLNSSDHLGQLIHLTQKIKENERLLKSADMILFLGDSNSVLGSVPLKKLGIKIGHIEAGMRSGDKTMFEEINRTICDHCSHTHFCYHEDYKQNLIKENLPEENIHVVGNTIVEVVQKYLPKGSKKEESILVDIHRQENFLNPKRLQAILDLANEAGKKYNLPVEMLNFIRTSNKISEYGLNIGSINLITQLGFRSYLEKVYHSKLLISDSGTAQEEVAFLKTPVLVPRDFTERWQSVESGCSVMQKLDESIAYEKLENLSYDTAWLGNGDTSDRIIEVLSNG